MSSKIDRIGEKNCNNFGSEMIIVDYRKAIDIDVYFPEYDWIAKGVQYNSFKTGLIKCSYEKRTYGIGYLGEGEYKASENGKDTRVYKTWTDMLQRCYDEKYQKRQPTYIGCEVCDEWLNFQNFAKWYDENYYEIEGEGNQLLERVIIKEIKYI